MFIISFIAPEWYKIVGWYSFSKLLSHLLQSVIPHIGLTDSFHAKLFITFKSLREWLMMMFSESILQGDDRQNRTVTNFKIIRTFPFSKNDVFHHAHIKVAWVFFQACTIKKNILLKTIIYFLFLMCSIPLYIGYSDVVVD